MSRYARLTFSLSLLRLMCAALLDLTFTVEAMQFHPLTFITDVFH